MYLIDPEMIPEDAPIDAEIEADINPGVEWKHLALRHGRYLPDSVRGVLDKSCNVPGRYARFIGAYLDKRAKERV